MLYVYSGPSLDHETLLRSLPASSTICPPIKGGDILTLLCDDTKPKPSHIHIIDGFYYNVPSVRHKEIIQAIDQGIIVSGCSSMGAIRAAECRDFGMIGTGRVYNFFATQFVSGDDEIAVAHHPAPSFEKISTPLINIRLTIADLCDEGLLQSRIGEEIIAYYKTLSFSQRYLRLLQQHDDFKEYYHLIAGRYQDWKRLDALESLELLGDMEQPSVPERKSFFSGYNHVNFYNDSSLSIMDRLLERCQLPNELNQTQNYQQVLYDSFNRALVVKFARHLGLSNTDAEVAAYQKFVDALRLADLRFQHLPVNYLNYTQEIVNQELMILKLHLWLIDSSGLSGNLGFISDYISCALSLNTTSSRQPSQQQRVVFYNSLLELFGQLTSSPEELISKYIGLSKQQFCSPISTQNQSHT